MLDLGAVIQQDLDHGNLNASLAGRRARRHESQRGASTAVHIRLGVDVSAGLDEKLGDACGVRRRLLPVVLDAVRRDVVEQRRAMLPRGPRANQLRMFAQQLSQCVLVAADDGIGCPLERLGLRACLLQCIEVRDERRPARKSM